MSKTVAVRQSNTMHHTVYKYITMTLEVALKIVHAKCKASTYSGFLESRRRNSQINMRRKYILYMNICICDTGLECLEPDKVQSSLNSTKEQCRKGDKHKATLARTYKYE